MTSLVELLAGGVTTSATAKTRLAAAVHDGYATLDAYAQWQPVIFILGCIGVALSVRQIKTRKRTPEVVALYAATGLASAGIAYVTRPDMLRPQASQGDSAVKRFLDFEDQRAAALSAKDPAWEQATWDRLSNDLLPVSP